MKLMFTLGMPRNNAWNGRWSGEENLYARIVDLGTSKKAVERAQAILANGPYYYSFGDGWRASVMPKVATSEDVRRVKRFSRGFCGYDWMIESILDCGEILVKERYA